MRTVLGWVFAGLAALICAVTFLSVIPTNIWWLQALNFPRLLAIIASAVIALGGVVFMRGGWRAGILVAMAATATLQGWRMYPYFPFASREVADASAIGIGRDAGCFTLLGLNVYQYNRDYAPTRALIERERPDILLLMETDQRWVDALAPVLARYPSQLLRPIDNTYGLVFATTLPVMSAITQNITDRDTPTVIARLATRDGRPFDYIGLHPRPPLPGQDTGLRDRKIAHAALQIAGNGVPAMAMGDFNDVAWSRTTRLFKQVGGYLDPRIGRGSYPSFPADYAAVGWPLDQLFVSPDFTFRSLRILEDVGADHRPLAAEICLVGPAARRANAAPDPLDDAAIEAARTMMDR